MFSLNDVSFRLSSRLRHRLRPVARRILFALEMRLLAARVTQRNHWMLTIVDTDLTDMQSVLLERAYPETTIEMFRGMSVLARASIQLTQRNQPVNASTLARSLSANTRRNVVENLADYVLFLESSGLSEDDGRLDAGITLPHLLQTLRMYVAEDVDAMEP